MELVSESEAAVMKRLQEATIKGDTDGFQQLISEHPRILELERCYLKQSSLHAAVRLGHLQLAKKMADQNPELCLARDGDGMNPVHLAAMLGNKEVVEALVETMPHAALETIPENKAGAETILHLCVKYYQLETLEFLIQKVDVCRSLINRKDYQGNTILHLAVLAIQPAMVESIVRTKNLQRSTINIYGKTALDICEGISKDNERRNKILQSLVKGRQFSSSFSFTTVKKVDESLLVAATIIATMAFQIGINPPGGVWQDDKLAGHNGHIAGHKGHIAGHNGHIAGQSILAYKNPHLYNILVTSNTLGLGSSLFVIFHLMGGWQFWRMFTHTMIVAMWISLSTTIITYSVAIKMLSPTVTTRLELSWVIMAIFLYGVCGGFNEVWFFCHIVPYFKKQRPDAQQQSHEDSV